MALVKEWEKELAALAPNVLVGKYTGREGGRAKLTSYMLHILVKHND